MTTPVTHLAGHVDYVHALWHFFVLRLSDVECFNRVLQALNLISIITVLECCYVRSDLKMTRNF